MAGRVKTYNPKEITISLGTHIVTGYGEDSFVTIESNTDGITKKVGCDGEVVRSISPDHTYNISLTLLMASDTCKWLQERLDQDRETGDGMFPILIKDLKGGMVFSSDSAWVVRPATRQFSREAPSREWQISTGEAEITEEG